MENLGKYFAELREQRNISYKKITEDLRIPEEKIRLIEENRFREIGEYGIMRAMTYNYARYLEADVGLVMAIFKAQYPESEKKRPQALEHPKEKRIMLSTNFLWTVAIVFIVIVLGSIIWIAYSKGFLQTPDIFASDADSLKTTQTKVLQAEEPAIADSGRTRMLELAEMMKPNPQEEEKEVEKHRQEVSSDTTDYMGKFLGKNPMNVQIH